MSDPDAMSIWRSNPELAHPPRFILDFGEGVRPIGFEVPIIGVGIINTEICEVAVTTERARRHIVRTLAQHDYAIILCDENPAGRFVDDTKTKHLNVERSGLQLASCFTVRPKNFTRRQESLRSLARSGAYPGPP